MYLNLYDKWKARTDTNADPNNDCLGIARILFCSYYFPYCKES